MEFSQVTYTLHVHSFGKARAQYGRNGSLLWSVSHSADSSQAQSFLSSRTTHSKPPFRYCHSTLHPAYSSLGYRWQTPHAEKKVHDAVAFIVIPCFHPRSSRLTVAQAGRFTQPGSVPTNPSISLNLQVSPSKHLQITSPWWYQKMRKALSNAQSGLCFPTLQALRRRSDLL